MTDEDVTLTIKESWLKDMVDAYNKYTKLDKENDKLKTENKWYSEQLNEAVKENQQLKEEIKMLKEAIYDLDGLECPKCGNYHRRGWTCSQCGYGK